MFPKIVINQKCCHLTCKKQILGSGNTNTLLTSYYNSAFTFIYKYHINITAKYHNVKSLNSFVNIDLKTLEHMPQKQKQKNLSKAKNKNKKKYFFSR